MTTLLLVASLLSPAYSQCLAANDNPAMLRREAMQQLTDARFDFALEALKKIAELDSSENVFFSPHSLYEALELAFFGSRGNTEKGLRKALHVPDDLGKVDVQRFYALEQALEAERKVTIT